MILYKEQASFGAYQSQQAYVPIWLPLPDVRYMGEILWFDWFLMENVLVDLLLWIKFLMWREMDIE